MWVHAECPGADGAAMILDFADSVFLSVGHISPAPPPVAGDGMNGRLRTRSSSRHKFRNRARTATRRQHADAVHRSPRTLIMGHRDADSR